MSTIRYNVPCRVRMHETTILTSRYGINAMQHVENDNDDDDDVDECSNKITHTAKLKCNGPRVLWT